MKLLSVLVKAFPHYKQLAGLAPLRHDHNPEQDLFATLSHPQVGAT